MAVWPTIVDYSTVLNKALFDSIQTYVDAVPSSLADGSAASPALRFTSDPNTGIYSNGADSIGFATNGTLRWYVNSNGHLAAAGVGTYDIGITNQFPRYVTVGGGLIVVGNQNAAAVDAARITSTAASGCLLQLTRVRGTISGFLPVLSGDSVGILQGRGYHSGNAYSQPGAIISFTASEDLTSTANGMAIDFATAAIGTTTATTRWTINNAGHLLAGADNAYDIGTSSVMPRIIYARTRVDIWGDGDPLVVRSFSNTNNPSIVQYRSRASFTAVNANDILGGFAGIGWHSGASWSLRAAAIYAQASESFTSTANGAYLQFRTTATGATTLTSRWRISDAGHFLTESDNSYDIGASGATRPRAIYVAGGITVGSTTLLTTSASLADGAAAQIGTLTNAPAAGNPTKWVPINDNGITRYIPAW